MCNAIRNDRFVMEKDRTIGRDWPSKSETGEIGGEQIGQLGAIGPRRGAWRPVGRLVGFSASWLLGFSASRLSDAIMPLATVSETSTLRRDTHRSPFVQLGLSHITYGPSRERIRPRIRKKWKERWLFRGKRRNVDTPRIYHSAFTWIVQLLSRAEYGLATFRSLV